MKEQIPKYAITIARLDSKGKTLFHSVAGANDLDMFTKTDLMKFVKHFKQLDQADLRLDTPLDAEIKKRASKRV